MELPPSLLAGLIGFVAGFFASIPVGPINITIINEGASRGFRWALFIGLGAVSMEVIYCVLAFAGFSNLFESRFMRAAMQLISFMLLIYLGWEYVRVKHLPSSTPSVRAMEERLHPHTAFMTGFLRVLANPVVLLFWIAVSATLVSQEWIADQWSRKLVCVAGVGAGGTTWFVILSFLVSLGHGRFSAISLVRLSRLSGLLLLIAAIFFGVRLVQLIARKS